jgi:hypothetical protein
MSKANRTEDAVYERRQRLRERLRAERIVGAASPSGPTGVSRAFQDRRKRLIEAGA